MRDNQETSPDIIQARYKARRNQFDLNVELALTNRSSVSSSSVGASAGASVESTGAVVQGGTGGGYIGGGDGGGGIGRCFGPSTLISLPNGTTRAIALIEVGDYIQVPQPDGSIQPGRVTSKHISLDKEWMEIATGVKPTIVKARHLFRAVGGSWQMIQYLDAVIGLRDEKWDLLPLTHKELIHGPERTFFTLGVDDPAHAFIADGYWVKNSKDTRLDDPEVV